MCRWLGAIKGPSCGLKLREEPCCGLQWKNFLPLGRCKNTLNSNYEQSQMWSKSPKGTHLEKMGGDCNGNKEREKRKSLTYVRWLMEHMHLRKLWLSLTPCSSHNLWGPHPQGLAALKAPHTADSSEGALLVLCVDLHRSVKVKSGGYLGCSPWEKWGSAGIRFY